ncbi:MAG: hypothetical protein A3J07_04410 [Candidatus Doudnabacteria bacterium RIFCSPLOWO2_02_FULL_49_13]|uniref:PilN domain-containing protein n=1 Tax=Candidatus Doudnabacteria bacterium RIFCSPHIGHO2_12_FULL_48_16 TaxID=1817838 RepID=A0A1F5PJN5_9BACT|nr:MAG: hypothetical protein A3B77_03155 [Candidatus Doudnabacteria bacterium RIFCSPHIGHO2_02_FULL_49_24]OGE89117.1 MAG: hypothetical protein A2760_04090 [Candidatus Doudnabacteria bacterium RIFCSPHIGHO2_01_FULL_50_67]OGE90153.1 MAG: hypothetical protein A3E29_03550 [Candidatus Doudnabacteria bacterium RIFCSPHIGHO2_12_FULL_48_16]OGE97224.1 MAG: hypothetical protein A2990_01355 [Candidatus Doudnabacteria bacterium RIFCSPLOWO2_01_FULL_49_40]OGF03295.1 MAG: hypothetical protein A3J07_04410 [Candid
MRRINLLPKIWQREFQLHLFANQLLAFWLWILITLVVFLIVVIVGRTYLISQNQQVLAAIETKRQTLKTSGNEELKLEILRLNQDIANVDKLNANHYYWSQALTELGNLLPSDLQIDLLTLDRATGKIEIKGTAGNRDNILKFWGDLHKSAYFMNINFPLSNLNQATNDPFTFTFYINPETVKQP